MINSVVPSSERTGKGPHHGFTTHVRGLFLGDVFWVAVCALTKC